ncbi:MAG: TonB-dependent receptor, partial [Leptothrix sp. (in: b-proteobacteria)]
GSHGLSAELNWKLDGGYTLTSLTAYKDYHFNAVNDEGTPFDVYRNAGGFWNDYKQTSQELRISSPLGGFVDYQAGLYAIYVHNSAEYQRVWGNDAGAWFANAGQYTRLDADAAGRQLLTNSLANLSMSFNNPAGLQEIRNKSGAGFAQANWHLSDPLTLTTGVRATHEDRRNNATSVVKSNGSAPELNPALVNGVDLGGFLSSATGDLLAGNSAAQLALADAAAKKYFGSASTYAALTAAQKRQLADAKAIRAAAIGVVFPNREAEAFRAWQPAFVVSPSYKFSPDQTGYVSWQYGQKAGISQFVNGVSSPVKAEKTNSLEVGLKSALLNKTLTLNTDLFFTTIKDYQQQVRVVDDYTTALNNDGRFAYTTATGNVPKVQASGLEVDGVYSGIRHTTLRFSGAYNVAVYKAFTQSAQPVEAGTSIAGQTIAPYRDVSGSLLSGAPRLSLNLGVDYRRPVTEDKEVFTSANVAYTGRFNSDTALSSYGWIKAATTVDASIGLGKRNQTFSVALLAKNLFNDATPRSQTWNSYAPAVPRTLGIVFTGKI